MHNTSNETLKLINKIVKATIKLNELSGNNDEIIDGVNTETVQSRTVEFKSASKKIKLNS